MPERTNDGLTQRQRNEIAYHRRHAKAKQELLRKPMNWDCLDRPSRRWWNAYWAMYARLTGLDLAGRRVLVVGCGFGHDAIRLAKLGASVHAFDLSLESLTVARQLADREVLPVAFAQMPAERLAYAPGQFECVVATDILHHVDIPVALAEIRRVSQPGAWFVMNEVYSHSWTNVIRRSALVEKFLYPRMRRFIYGPRQPYITPDERKLNEGDIATIVGSLQPGWQADYFHCFVSRLVPSRYVRCARADRLLLRAVLALLLVAGLALRILCYSGLGVSDSLGYISAAGNLAQGHFPWQDYPAAYASVGLIVPITPLVMLGGYTSWLPTLYSLACGLGLILVAYWLGAQLVQGSTGLWAAFVVAFSTLAIGTAMAVMPDTPLAFWTSLCVALVVYAQHNADRRRTFLLCFAAGIALGIAWCTKITTVFVFPVVLLGLLPMTGRRAVALAGGCAGFLLMLLAYAGFWALATGDPWDGLRCLPVGVSEPGTAGVPLAPRHSLWAYPIKMFIVVSDDGLFYYFLLPALLWAVACRWRELWLPVAWVAIVFLCLQFGSTSLSTYRPFPHNARYLMLLLPAGAVLIGAALAHMAARRPRFAGVVAAGYATACAFVAFLHPALAGSDLTAATTAVGVLQRERPDAVFADRRFASIFNYARLDSPESVPLAEVWLDENLEPVRAPLGQGKTFVVRYDGSVRRYQATRGNYQPLDIDAAYAWVERNADKTVIEIDHARLQRPALAAIAQLVNQVPFPEPLAARLGTTLSRHLARRLVVIYHIRDARDRASTVPGEVINPR